MGQFWRFTWALIKKWWPLMSCAAFTLLSLVSALAPNGSKLTVAGTFLLAIVFGVFGAFQLWSEQHKRAVKAEQDLATYIQLPSVRSADWEEMARQLEASCRFFRADFQTESITGYQSWDVKGGPESGICEAWIGKAGAMLLRSPNVFLPNAIRDEQFHGQRWLRYMQHHGCFEAKLIGYETLDDGRRNLVQTGTTRNFVYDCIRLCIQCSAAELSKKD